MRCLSMISVCTVTLFMSCLCMSVYGRVLKEAPEAAGMNTGPTCIFSESSTSCIAHPAIAFTVQQDAAQPADGLYQTIMAHHVLCSQQKSRQQCYADSSLYCIWHQERQRCEADGYASYLLPLTCPGSKARAYLGCMRKTSMPACKADPACTAEVADTCYPRSMIQEAKAANASVQDLAERTALSLVSGDLEVLGSCDGSKALQHLVELCPYGNSWGNCSETYCTFDIPPYIPRRQRTYKQDDQQPESSSTAVRHSRKANITSSSTGSSPKKAVAKQSEDGLEGLPYYGINPAPICAINVGKLPAVLHEMLHVSQQLQAAVAEANKECNAAETVQYSARNKAATCGPETFEYKMANVLEAIGVLDTAKSRPAVATKHQRSSTTAVTTASTASNGTGRKTRQNANKHQHQ